MKATKSTLHKTNLHCNNCLVEKKNRQNLCLSNPFHSHSLTLCICQKSGGMFTLSSVHLQYHLFAKASIIPQGNDSIGLTPTKSVSLFFLFFFTLTSYEITFLTACCQLPYELAKLSLQLIRLFCFVFLTEIDDDSSLLITKLNDQKIIHTILETLFFSSQAR